MLNATHAIVTGGAGLWTTSNPQLLQWADVGDLLGAGPGGPASPEKDIVANVNGCGDVHVYRVPERGVWRIVMSGSDGDCMDSKNASISPLIIVWEAPHLQVGGWQFQGVLYRGQPGDGPRVECPTYFSISNAQNTTVSVALFSYPYSAARDSQGTYWATGLEQPSNGSTFGELLEIRQRGVQQSGGYANEAFYDVEGDRWIVYSWLMVRGSVNCTNSLNRSLPGCWVGAQSLPRQVALQSDGWTLKFPPVPELRQLMVLPGANFSKTIKGSTNQTVPMGDLRAGPQAHVDLRLSNLLQWNGTFSLDCLARGAPSLVVTRVS